MTLFLFVNLIIVITRNTLIPTSREGVNGQQYKQIENSQLIKTIWLKKRQNEITKRGGGGEIIIF